MPPAAGVVSRSDRIPMNPAAAPPQTQLPIVAAAEAHAKDAVIAWFRGEFAAANAIIDALCGHLALLDGGAAGEAYGPAFAAIHRRRMNWIPILQMQKYYPIADVAEELRKVAEVKKVPPPPPAAADGEEEKSKDLNLESSMESNEGGDGGGGEVVDEDFTSEITDTGSQEVQNFPENVDICSNHDNCEARRAQIKITKGFVAKEPIKGHTVNVVRGLKLYEDIFTDVELSKLNDFVNELRSAGQNGELSGETFILYNQQRKGNKRELIQLGVPIFGKIKEDEINTVQKNYIEPIPTLLQGVIEHLIQWRLIPENRTPNSCIISFFDEGEYSQPFLKPPHLEHPLSTFLLHESTMAFGRTLVSYGEGNYRGSLMLSLKKGSLLVMKGNSSDMARHAMCSSLNKRTSITFFRVRTESENNHPSETNYSFSKAMSVWQPGVHAPYTVPNWSPVVMLAPVSPMVVSPRRGPRDGTGVFLPWAVGSRKHMKQLPPRAQRGRFLALPPPVGSVKNESGSD
ncbi:oxidoreductase- 2OG-Fe(II) oxygenase family protein [Striga hermonthica]|uniref:Oxidoreductase- 2OG-Fe(II) oxygenase family protein n=1 Tax=Striga hermonthica TaxID=68872 RepID=A0A9N7RL43_STRHE|nr:oxidoreductase- 2OG-Fe(II) oxygenase family protein [Striga hermonthica]